MGGIRVNEAFGDTVNWDLIPTNAIDRADVWSSNPVFGLNALGGAVNIGMKNGFTYQGFEGEVQGGSFGRGSAAAQYGVQRDDGLVDAVVKRPQELRPEERPEAAAFQKVFESAMSH